MICVICGRNGQMWRVSKQAIMELQNRYKFTIESMEGKKWKGLKSHTDLRVCVTCRKKYIRRKYY